MMDIETAARIVDPDAWHEKAPADGCSEFWSGRRSKAREKAKAILDGAAEPGGDMRTGRVLDAVLEIVHDEGPGNPEGDWTEYARTQADMRDRISKRVRSLFTGRLPGKTSRPGTADAIGEIMTPVLALARDDVRRTSTDFVGRMQEAMCEFERICDEHPTGDLPADDARTAIEELQALAGLTLAQIAMLCDPGNPLAMLPLQNGGRDPGSDGEVEEDGYDDRNAMAIALDIAEQDYAGDAGIAALAATLRTSIGLAKLNGSSYDTLLAGWRKGIEGREGYGVMTTMDTGLIQYVAREVGTLHEVGVVTMALVAALQAHGETIDL